MQPSIANNGEEHRLVASTTAELTTNDDSIVFDLGPTLEIDWGAFQAGFNRTYLIKPTDNISVDLTGLLIQVLIVSTDVPVQINFTQDGVARIMKVKPLVNPTAYFSSTHSPSEQPNDIQRGHVMLVGGDITVLSLVGLASMPSANVRVAVAGYRS